MSVQIPELERRLQAHERMLHALIARLDQERPGFLDRVMAEADLEEAPAAAAPKASAAPQPVLFRATPHAGAWRVTRDGDFVGDYAQPQLALAAALSEAADLRETARGAEVLFDGLANAPNDPPEGRRPEARGSSVIRPFR